MSKLDSQKSKRNKQNKISLSDYLIYKEGRGTQANELATRWVHKADVNQTLISFNDSWYLIEKFDDSEWGYQIMERISKAKYDKIVKEIQENGKSGRVQSLQRTFTDYAQFDKGNDTTRGKESSSNSLQVEHGGENPQILRLDRAESQGQHAQRNGNVNRKSSSSSKQGVKNIADIQLFLGNADKNA